uniref:Uncharacterized protein n=1 Tax=Macaca fascicularis TaxID=9541 RepID=Q8HXD1_MACFA|nr:hypothetical protein [Macaca fascicularis]
MWESLIMLQKSPEGPFTKPAGQLPFCCTVTTVASAVCDLYHSESSYPVTILFPLLSPLVFLYLNVAVLPKHISPFLLSLCHFPASAADTLCCLDPLFYNLAMEVHV